MYRAFCILMRMEGFQPTADPPLAENPIGATKDMKRPLIVLGGILSLIILLGYSIPMAPAGVQVPLHYAPYSDKEFFETAFQNIPQDTPILPASVIQGLVVPHHLLAAPLIAQTMSRVTSNEKITVVLISPNHFSAGSAPVLASLYDWQTPYGILAADTKTIGVLEKQNLVKVEEAPFAHEHGIANVVAFIKKVLPYATLVPLMVKDTLPLADTKKITADIVAALPTSTLVIASLDFSHYLPSSAAQFHDAKSVAVMSNFVYEGIRFLDIDSRPGLGIFLHMLEDKGAKAFTMFKNTNSAY